MREYFKMVHRSCRHKSKTLSVPSFSRYWKQRIGSPSLSGYLSYSFANDLTIVCIFDREHTMRKRSYKLISCCCCLDSLTLLSYKLDLRLFCFPRGLVEQMLLILFLKKICLKDSASKICLILSDYSKWFWNLFQIPSFNCSIFHETFYEIPFDNNMQKLSPIFFSEWIWLSQLARHQRRKSDFSI